MGKYYFLLILVLFFSCKKAELISDKPDNIIYQYYGEENFISTIVSYSVDPLYSRSLATPSDSSACMNIDIDMNSTNDFVFTASHSPDYCGHSSFIYKIIRINGMNEGDSIRELFVGSPGPNPEKLDSTIDISKNGEWTDQAYFLISWPCYGVSSHLYSFDDMVIGIKKGNRFGWLHVKPKGENGICLLESAINLTDNNSIFAGQKQ
jgi:hypothetical protein